MSGVTKHIYDREIRDIIMMWNKQIKEIQSVLPQYYTDADIVSAIKYYYPHEWNSVKFKYSYYQAKDKCLKKRFNQKIEMASSKTQQVTPSFIDQLVGLYERKNTSQIDRMYILLELKKYYSSKIIQFFFKLNDTELNKQLRWDAFYHLQSFNYHPRARRQKYMQVHTNNIKRKVYLKDIYPNQTYTIPQTPYELEYRIENSKEQKIKEYDFFISHSSKDSLLVQKLIKFENQQGKNIFCDWINDVDYLKRHLVCASTLKVIEKRIEQSKALIFVASANSMDSVWCKYELNYFKELNKPMYIVQIEDIKSNIFNINFLESNWYIDPNYKELALLSGLHIKV